MLIIEKIKQLSDQRFNILVWIVVFSFALIITVLIQLILLPKIFVAWHAGNGLLAGGDWVAFHKAAVVLADQIRTDGWSAWELRPRGWMPAGVAAAFYVVFGSKPLVLAPLNAAVHATSALLLFQIVRQISGDRYAAFLSIFPLIVFPTTMIIYAQIHRDGYNLLGVLLLIHGFVTIWNQKKANDLLKAIIFALTGLLIIWLVRPHALGIYLVAGLILYVPTTVVSLVRACFKKLSWKSMVVNLVSYGLILAVAGSVYMHGNSSDKYLMVAEPEKPVNGSATVLQVNTGSVTFRPYEWEKVGWLPPRIDEQFQSMAVLRSVTYPERYSHMASGIDLDVTFHSANDYILYLPRSLQIAFLAPFPPDWFKQGSRQWTTFFRRIIAFEMIIIYLLIVPFLFSLWRWRNKFEYFHIIAFCTLVILVFVYSVPNVGTMYRYRLGYMLVLVAFGIASLYIYFKDLKVLRTANANHKEVL